MSLSAKDGQLSLRATNLESGIIFNIGAKIEKEGETTIPAKTLVEFISSLPADKIDFSLEENSLKISCQRFKATINGLPASEFPPLPQGTGEPSLSFKTEEISLPISQVAFAAAQDESRPVLSGVKFLGSEEGLTLAATDGFRLSLKKLSKIKTEKGIDLILPARVLIEVIRILNEGKEEELGLEIAKEANQAIFILSNGKIVCRLLEGQYPDFEKIIPTSFISRATISKDELLSAVRSASIFARESANIIRFKTQQEKFLVLANAPQVGESASEIEAKIEGEDGEIAFNSRFLLDYLAVVPEEEIVFEMSGPLSPGVFKLVKDDSFLQIIMPVRVQPENSS
jgi:DNA polymerase-3 subunit beta